MWLTTDSSKKSAKSRELTIFWSLLVMQRLGGNLRGWRSNSVSLMKDRNKNNRKNWRRNCSTIKTKLIKNYKIVLSSLIWPKLDLETGKVEIVVACKMLNLRATTQPTTRATPPSEGQMLMGNQEGHCMNFSKIKISLRRRRLKKPLLHLNKSQCSTQASFKADPASIRRARK